MTHTEQELSALTADLDTWGLVYDREGAWPQRCVERLGQAGGWRWNVPVAYGGDPLPHGDLLRAYGAVAAGCMSTALISTQRDGAVELIAGSDRGALKEALLPALAKGAFYTTVGISQLTTSKRGGGHLMRATADGDCYRLSGVMPWATGAEQARVIVTGAVLDDGQQLRACVPTDRDGLCVEAPDDLITLNPSRTSRVTCHNVLIHADELLRGPAERVLKLRTPVKPLVTSACGLGVASALLTAITRQPERARAAFSGTLAALAARFEDVRGQLFAAARQVDDPTFEVPSSNIRLQVNELLARLAVTALTVCKGSGFQTDHPVQRHVREALFFLVWSAPTDLQAQTLERLMAPLGGDGLASSTA